MELARIARDKQMDYTDELISRICSSEDPAKIMRYFRYRKLQRRDGFITKKTLMAEFAVGETCAKKYLAELEAVDEKKPRSYRFPHGAKLLLNVIERL